MAQVGHLNELQEKYEAKGLTVLSISKEPRSAIDGFVEKTGAKVPIVLVDDGVLQDYEVTGYPSAFLVGPNGRILWAGHPGNLPEDTITSHLEKVRPAPVFPGKLAPLAKPFERERFGECHAKVARLLLTPGLADEDRTAAEAVREWLEWNGTCALEGAAADAAASKPYEAWSTYEEVAASYKGHAFAADARKAVAALVADKDSKREIDARQRLEKAREQARDMSPGKARKLYEQIAEKYEGTKAAARAGDLARAIESD